MRADMMLEFIRFIRESLAQIRKSTGNSGLTTQD